MARPTTYNFELCEQICAAVAEGGHIKEILKKKRKYPSFGTWCKWKREHLELLNLYISSNQDKTESIIEKIRDLEQKVEDGSIEARPARLLIDTLKWKAAKFYPKMYGTQASIDITTAGKEVTQQVTVFQLPDNGRGEIAKKKEE